MQTISNYLSILIIEDNPADYFLIEEMLQSPGLRIKNIYQATRTADALVILNEQAIDLVLLDLSLPDSFGIESFLNIKAETAHIPVIILSGLTQSDVALEALQQGAQDYLVKGEFKSNLLLKSIQYSIERKNAEEKIIESEEKYRQMFYKNPFPALIYDLKSLQVLEINEAAIQKYGYPKEEFLKLTIEDLLSEKDTEEWKQFTSNEIQNGKMQSRFQEHKKKNGNTIIAEVTYYQINYFGNIAMQAQINDVTETLRMEKELLEQHTLKQRQITEAVLNAQEKERKIIGAELHDNINQILATSKLYFSVAMENKNNTKEMLAKGGEYIVLAIDEIRKLSKKLVAPPFIEQGLKVAIEELALNCMIEKKITIKTILTGFEDNNLSNELKITIYRIIQEQMNNTLKYAAASAVTININSVENKILLDIKDNGVGFDTDKRSNGIGITNIQTRAELFNGRMEIESSPGKGCRLKVELESKMEKPQRAA